MSNYTSRYVQLTEFCLLEWQYTDLISPETLSYSFTVVQNNHFGYNQILNQDAADTVTRNVRERSVTKIGAAKYADLDKDDLPDWITYDSLLSSAVISGPYSPPAYDTVRMHIVSGYSFDDLDGVIFEIRAKERSGKYLTLANIAFLKDSDFFEFNPRPIFLGDRLYDRFVQVKVPALKLNNDDYNALLDADPAKKLTFVNQITSDGITFNGPTFLGKGFLRAQPIEVSAIEIKSTEALTVGSATYNLYGIGATKTVPVNQADEFSNLGAVIRPSDAGDYFEYFASWGGGFIEDFIFNANALTGNNYIVLHELRVLEQVGSVFSQTAYFQTIQESDYDLPQTFRPVVKNASRAVSFTIEYTTRLFNKADSSQIIRIANYTDLDPKAWGPQMQRIELLTAPDPHKVYNKIVGGPVVHQNAFVQNAQQVNPYATKLVPSFFDRTMVSIQKDTVQLDSTGRLTSARTPSTQTIFGQGEANIIVTPFDNYYKFSVLRTEATRGRAPGPLDLGWNATFSLVFVNDNGQKVRFPAVTDTIIGDHARGDLLFKVPGDDGEKVLKFSKREFWIVSRFQDGNETSIYQGVFNEVTERTQAKVNEQAAQDAAATGLEQKIKELEVTLPSRDPRLSDAVGRPLFTRPPTPVASGTVVTTASDQPVTPRGIKIPAGTKPSTEAQIKVQIPGLAIDIPSTKSSIIASITPRSVQATPVQTTVTQAKLATGGRG